MTAPKARTRQLVGSARRKRSGSRVGAALLIALLIASLVAYKLTGNTLVAYLAGSLLVYPLPYEYLRRLRPYRAVSASIMATMLTGSLIALALYFYRRIDNISVDTPFLAWVSLGYAGSLLTAGLAGMFASSLAWGSLLLIVLRGGCSDYRVVILLSLGGLALSFSSVLGMIVFRSIRRRSALESRTVLVISLLTVVFYLALLYVGLNSGGLDKYLAPLKSILRRV